MLQEKMLVYDGEKINREEWIVLQNLRTEMGKNITCTIVKNHLEEINVSNMELKFLNSIIGKLENLRILYLNDNQLVSLPEGLGQLTSLQTLNLRDNQLVSLPKSLGQLTNLQKQDLKEKQKNSQPEIIAEITKQIKLK